MTFGFIEEFVNFLFWNGKINLIKVNGHVDYESYNTNDGRGNIIFCYTAAVDYAKQSLFSVLKHGKCQSRIEYGKKNNYNVSRTICQYDCCLTLSVI